MMTTASPCGVLEAGEHRGLLAEVAAEGDIAGTRVGLGDLLEERERPVLASVIDIDQLEFLPQQGKFGGHMVVEAADDLLFVEARDNYRDQHGRTTSHPNVVGGFAT